ncbi:MAG TPA: DUF222 domain-containing protein [Mycobacterium sp.]|nr:DUF222 domain-containing protein [Mycobacterium sp.]
MSAVVQHTGPQVALSAAHLAVDELQGLDLTGLSDEAVLALWQELERLRRRLPAVEHQLVLEAEGRDLPGEHQLRGVPQLLRGLLRLDPGEATARVQAAHAAGARRSLTGQPVPALFAQLATAQAAGSLSERQARIITATIDKLPEQLREEHWDEIETDLVGYAQRFDPIGLAKIAERIRYCYDPDGSLDDVEYRAKQRGFSLNKRADGSAKLSGEATPELTELLELHLDALASPRPAVDGVKDPRTAEQRRHDTLLDALKLSIRAQQLPTVGGITTTIVLTMTAEDFAARRGLAHTSHGALIPVPEAMRIAAGEYRLMNVVLDHTHKVTAYSSIHRLFTEAQRLAMFATDGAGCSFPDCPIPIHWCQIDHATDYADGGPTTIDNGVPACRYHNLHAKQGWRSARISGRAAWIPPRWIDAQQRPRYNLLHLPGPPS